MSDVEIEFTFPMIFQTTANYKQQFSPRPFTLFLKCRSLNVNVSDFGLTEICIHISRFTMVRPLRRTKLLCIQKLP